MEKNDMEIIATPVLGCWADDDRYIKEQTSLFYYIKWNNA